MRVLLREKVVHCHSRNRAVGVLLLLLVTRLLSAQLVNTLTTQLHGTISLIRDHGTAFSIAFPVEA